MKKKILASVLILILSLGTILPAFAASGRDCDGNAIIRCGALSVSELKKDINGSTQLTQLFGKMGIKTSQFSGLKEGVVQKDGDVVVNGKVVARGVNSFGRHYIKGSHRDYRFNYPIYYRHPSVSFNSNSLSAFVKLNYDGSFAYAVIKACGNPVLKGTRANIKVAPKFNVTINKFADDNENKKKDWNEKSLKNVTFTISGNGIRTQWKATNTGGQVVFSSLPAGTYKVQESYNTDYWRPTTSSNGIQYVTVNGNEVMWFGNKWVKKADTHNLIVNKFEDLNKNKQKDSNEVMLRDFQFNLTGNGASQTLRTDAQGQAVFTGLKNGDYTVTEVNQQNWTATTQNPLIVRVNNGDAWAWFGNVRTPISVNQNKSLIVYKFEDKNGNRIRENSEPLLSDWTFRIKGNNVNKVGKTDSNGGLVFTDIPAGDYTLTETSKNGWVATTTNPLKITVKGQDVMVWFGNKKIKSILKTKSIETVEETPEEVLVKAASLPEAGAKEAAAAFSLFSLIGSAYYYLRSRRLLKNQKV